MPHAQQKIRERSSVLSGQMFMVQGGPDLAGRQVLGLLQALQIDGQPGRPDALVGGGHPFLAEFMRDAPFGAFHRPAPLPSGGGWAAEFQQQQRPVPLAGHAWADEFATAPRPWCEPFSSHSQHVLAPVR